MLLLGACLINFLANKIKKLKTIAPHAKRGKLGKEKIDTTEGNEMERVRFCERKNERMIAS